MKNKVYICLTSQAAGSEIEFASNISSFLFLPASLNINIIKD